jgi:D-alanyl-D-alanine carboxypeptidase
MYRALVERGDVTWEDSCSVLLPWWSLSKTAIASAALVLVQQGRLTLDDAVAGQAYNLRQLLQHTAGLPDYGGLSEYHQAVASGTPPWSRRELFERLDSHQLCSPPGLRFRYSNIGYLIVRTLVEDASGLTLGDALDELVFNPLDLGAVRLAAEPSDLNGPWTPAGYHPGWVFHGLVIGPPSSAALFLDRLLNGQLLDVSVLASMRQPFTVSETSIANRPWNSAGYGLGLMIDIHSPLGPCYGHTGTGPGSTTATYWFEGLPQKTTVAVFAGIEDQGSVERQVLALAKHPRA